MKTTQYWSVQVNPGSSLMMLHFARLPTASDVAEAIKQSDRYEQDPLQFESELARIKDGRFVAVCDVLHLNGDSDGHAIDRQERPGGGGGMPVSQARGDDPTPDASGGVQAPEGLLARAAAA